VNLSEQPNINAYNIDCMEWMKGKPDNYYDLAIVDPPYGIGAENHAGNKENGWTQWPKKAWDNIVPTVKYFNELTRVSNEQVIWGGNYFKLPPSQCWLVWDKGQRGFSLADGELAWTSFKKSLRIYEYSRGRANSEGKCHPTQKPVQLYRWILSRYAEPGQRILDTHGGSFSSAIACHNEGYDLDICELDEDYFRDAVKRFKLNTVQGSLF